MLHWDGFYVACNTTKSSKVEYLPFCFSSSLDLWDGCQIFTFHLKLQSPVLIQDSVKTSSYSTSCPLCVCVCVCVCVCARKEIMHNPVSNKGTSWTSTSASSLSPPVCSHSSTSSPTRDGAPSWYQWNFKYHQRYLMSAWYENISQHLILSPGITCLCVALRIEEI